MFNYVTRSVWRPSTFLFQSFRDELIAFVVTLAGEKPSLPANPSFQDVDVTLSRQAIVATIVVDLHNYTIKEQCGMLNATEPGEKSL